MRPYLPEIAHHAFEVLPLLGRKLLSHHEGENFMDGLTRNHIGVMFILKRFEKLRMSELGQKSGLAKSNLTPIVDWLADRAMVRREADPEDRRAVQIELTASGKEFLEKTWQHIQTQFEKCFQTLTDDDLGRFSGALSVVTEILNKI